MLQCTPTPHPAAPQPHVLQHLTRGEQEQGRDPSARGRHPQGLGVLVGLSTRQGWHCLGPVMLHRGQRDMAGSTPPAWLWPTQVGVGAGPAPAAGALLTMGCILHPGMPRGWAGTPPSSAASLQERVQVQGSISAYLA